MWRTSILSRLRKALTVPINCQNKYNCHKCHCLQFYFVQNKFHYLNFYRSSFLKTFGFENATYANYSTNWQDQRDIRFDCKICIFNLVQSSQQTQTRTHKKDYAQLPNVRETQETTKTYKDLLNVNKQTNTSFF